MGKQKKIQSDEESENYKINNKNSKKTQNNSQVKKRKYSFSEDSASVEKIKKQADIKEEQDCDDTILNVQFLPGQKYKTPVEGDGTRIFYESLYEQNPQSKMAEKWCLENGVLTQDQAENIIKLSKKANKK